MYELNLECRSCGHAPLEPYVFRHARIFAVICRNKLLGFLQERRSRILFFRGYWEHKTVICYY